MSIEDPTGDEAQRCEARHPRVMAALCHELLKSDISTTLVTGSIMDLIFRHLDLENHYKRMARTLR
jgi:hypothetical protein